MSMRVALVPDDFHPGVAFASPPVMSLTNPISGIAVVGSIVG
jgi:hypothetical protein